MILDPNRLRNIRLYRGISQAELSRRIRGINENFVSSIENGMEGVRIYVIYALAKELDVSFDDLCTYPLAYGRGEYGQPCPPICYDLRSTIGRKRRTVAEINANLQRTKRRNAIWYHRHIHRCLSNKKHP